MSLFGVTLRKRLLCIFVFAAFSAFLVSAAFAGDEGLLEELIQRQGRLKTVQASFVQEKYDPMLGRPINSEGTFYLEIGSGVRWEYEDVLVVYNGEFLYVYSPETEEAEKIKGKQGFMGPLAFDLKELLKDYYIEASRDGENIKVRLSPKKEMPFESMEMFFEGQEAFPSKVSIIDASGQTSAITFHNIKLNTHFSDDLFVFHPPPGTVVRERDFE